MRTDAPAPASPPTTHVIRLAAPLQPVTFVHAPAPVLAPPIPSAPTQPAFAVAEAAAAAQELLFLSSGAKK